MTTSPNPPSPRRCLRILEAHHLSCQGLSLRQISERLDCARSTVSGYLRDFQIHRAHILHSVAADRLADQVHLLTQPDAEPAQHRRQIAAARELRLLLRDLPRLQEHDEQRRAQVEAIRNAPAIALARSRNRYAGPDGHARYFAGPDKGQCTDKCAMCHPEIYETDDAQPSTLDSFGDPLPSPITDSFGDPLPSSDLTEPDLSEPDPDPSPPFPDESDLIQTNLDKSEHLDDEKPAPGAVAVLPPKNLRRTPAHPPIEPSRRDDPFTITTIGTITIDAPEADYPGQPLVFPRISHRPYRWP